MEIIHLAATHSDQRKVFNGRYSRQLTWGAGQHDHLTRLLLLKKLNAPWQLIGLSIVFAIGRINYFLARGWESRPSRANATPEGVGNE